MTIESPGLDVLNIAAGHLKFRFDKGNADEVDKAKKVLTDMLKRGYMLFVVDGGEQKRVRQFDPEREEYILEEPDVIPEADPVATPVRHATGRRSGKRVSMHKARATGIGPTAGG